jgi:hypothetical protein
MTRHTDLGSVVEAVGHRKGGDVDVDVDVARRESFKLPTGAFLHFRIGGAKHFKRCFPAWVASPCLINFAASEEAEREIALIN